MLIEINNSNVNFLLISKLLNSDSEENAFPSSSPEIQDQLNTVTFNLT